MDRLWQNAPNKDEADAIVHAKQVMAEMIALYADRIASGQGGDALKKELAKLQQERRSLPNSAAVKKALEVYSPLLKELYLKGV